MRRDSARRKWYATVLVATLCAGCAASPEPNREQSTASRASGFDTALLGAHGAQCETEGPLKELRSQRMSSAGSYDYPLGPGDILRIAAAELPELNDATARVDGEGNIDLPLLGGMRVGGLSEGEVTRLIDEEARKFQKEPRIHLFIRHFAGRNVEVMGMVAQPGSYALDSPDESLLGVLGRAGGIKGVGNEDAADILVLFPARIGDAAGSQRPIAQDCAEAGGASATDASIGCTSAAMLKGINADRASQGPGANVEPIIIDLSKPEMAGCLDTPARPGDVIVVPPAGQVGVYGWVSKPGSFNITPGLTVLGAITAAGGAMFSSNVEVKRTEHGARVSMPLDLSKVEEGSDRDMTIRAGDVVLVRGSVAGAVPYAVYTLFSKFGTGLYMAPAAF